MFGAKSILLIDGHHEDLWYYSHRLRLASPNSVILQAATGQAGLDLCTSHSIDCVIMEIELPDMSGFEALAKFASNAEYPQIPVIMLTRLSNPDLLDLARKNGAHAGLRKLATSDDVLNQTILKLLRPCQRALPRGKNSCDYRGSDS